MAHTTLPDASALAALVGQLKEVITLAEAGNWDGIVARETSLTHALAALSGDTKSGFQISAKFPADHQALREVQTLLDRASELLVSRRDTIAPLVTALKPLSINTRG